MLHICGKQYFEGHLMHIGQPLRSLREEYFGSCQLKVAEIRAGAKNVKPQKAQRRSGIRPKLVKNRPFKKNAVFAPSERMGGLTGTKKRLP